MLDLLLRWSQMFLDGAPTPPIDPSPASPAAAGVQTRVRSENLMVALICLVVATFAIVGVVAMRQPAEPATSATTQAPATAQPLDAAADPALATTSMTLADATALVDEARQLMREARWDEAADRLASVPEQLAVATGSGSLALELQVARERHGQLRAELDAAVEARQWQQADGLLDELAGIAQLDQQLLDLRAVVDAALAPEEPVRETTPAPETTAKPATDTASKPKPKPTPAAKPAAQPAATGSTKDPAAPAPASGTNATAERPNPLAPVEYTDEQLAAVNAALGYATGELK